jgi:cell division protein FtsN
LFSGYALQAGIFSDLRRAEELHAKLTLNGIPSTFEARVNVGPFKRREEAIAAREKMKALGIDSVLLLPKGVKR